MEINYSKKHKFNDPLMQLWHAIRDIPRWYHYLAEGNFPKDKLKQLEKIDEKAITYDKEAKRAYYQEEIPKVRKKIKEFKKEFPKQFKTDRRINYLTTRIHDLNRKIKQVWKDDYDATQRADPFWFKRAIRHLKCQPKMEKERANLQNRLYLAKHPSSTLKKHEITPERIQKATEYPFDQLIKANKAKMAKCPFHEDQRPSFYIKNNWGYCFGCNWNGDTIAFVMEKDGLSFIEAIKYLT